jgi:hypothetical protein
VTSPKTYPPTSPRFRPRGGQILPPLEWRESPNVSDRRNDIVPYLIVIHRPVGSYRPTVEWLCNPRSDASAHVVSEGDGTGRNVATQLVRWERKAWTCAAYNSISYNIEVDDNAWDGSDWSAFYSAAHIAAWICHRTNIPPVWSWNASTQPGVIRHLDLGKAGGGHSDPTDNLQLWKNFVWQVAYDVKNTHWRKSWGRGTFKRIRVDV